MAENFRNAPMQTSKAPQVNRLSRAELSEGSGVDRTGSPSLRPRAENTFCWVRQHGPRSLNIFVLGEVLELSSTPMMVPAMVNVLRVSDFNGRAFGAALDALMGRRVKTINDTVMVCHAFMLIELSGVHVLADCEVDATIPATRPCAQKGSSRESATPQANN
jgi:hypothetical protein